MFEKQWFSEASQEGLGNDALNFEKEISKRNIDKCLNIIKNSNSKNKDYWKRMEKRLKNISKRKKKYILTGVKPPIFLMWEGFWPDMNSKDCQILDFLKESLPDEEFLVTNNSGKADILISSCLGKNNPISRKYNHCFKILFLGENLRPYFSNYDLSISSDINTYRGRNIYLPLWLFEIDLFKRGQDYPDRKVYNISNFCKSKIIDFSKRESGIVYIGNNSEPFRESIIQEIQDNKIKIDRFGSHTKPIKDKISLISKYKGTLAMENSIYPGYITEKGMHAFLGGSKTIYWGSREYSPFNDHPLFVNINPDQPYDLILDKVLSITKENNKVFVPGLLEENKVLNFKNEIIAKMKKSLSQFIL